MKFEVIDHPSSASAELVAGVRRYNDAKVGPSGSVPLSVLARSEDGALVGGVSGRTAYRHLLIDVVWVAEVARGGSIGRQLMAMAEDAAIARGCVAAQVDTLSFQTPGFYRKLGFEVVGTIDDFPAGTPAFSC